MARAVPLIHAFNAGVIDPENLARVDLEQMRLAAEEQTNFIPYAVGRAIMRPGFEYSGNCETNDVGWLLPFVRGVEEAVVIELSNGAMRVLSGGVPISRSAVTSTVTNGDFASFTGWTDASIHGGTATSTGSLLQLFCPNLGAKAVAKQQVSTSNANTEHALRIVVQLGPVRFRVGSADGGDDLISEITLRDGVHSLAFTPTTSSYWVQLSSTSSNVKYVDSIQVEGAGSISIPVPWATTDFQKIRFAQSIDVMFIACAGYQQRRIERRANGRSWAVCTYKVDDGPFKVSATQSIKMTPSSLNGNGTLTSSSSYFKPEHVGMTMRLFHSGQNVARIIGNEDYYTDAIRVTGVVSGDINDRDYSLAISGTWSGTVTLYRSVDSETSGYSRWRSYTTNQSLAITDNQNNEITYYRVGMGPGEYTSGSAVVSIGYDGGGGYGICRIINYISPTQVSIEILTPFKGTSATTDWREGEWSHLSTDGWPTAVSFYDGRLWWGRNDRFWGSISDAYESFDESQTGDSAPISRSISTGGINMIQWIMPLQRLIFGTNGSETSARSSSLDEPLTVTNLTLRDASTVGSGFVDCSKIDSRGLFVDKSGTMVWELLYDNQSFDYSSARLSRLASSLFTASIVKMSVMRRPDTRVWILLDDGRLICCVYEPAQKVLAFIPIETDGFIGSITVIPEDDQDRLFTRVRRSVNGVDTWMIEKMAYDAEALPLAICKCVDSSRTGTNSPAAASISGLANLEGESVKVWADGDAIPGTFPVSGGVINLPKAVGSWCVGRPYEGRYKSARLAYGATPSLALVMPQRVDHVGLILSGFHRDGVSYGPDFDHLDPLPVMEGYEEAASIPGGVLSETPYAFDGIWDTNARVCIKVESPYPASLLSLIIGMKTSDK